MWACVVVWNPAMTFSAPNLSDLLLFVAGLEQHPFGSLVLLLLVVAGLALVKMRRPSAWQR